MTCMIFFILFFWKMIYKDIFGKYAFYKIFFFFLEKGCMMEPRYSWFFGKIFEWVFEQQYGEFLFFEKEFNFWKKNFILFLKRDFIIFWSFSKIGTEKLFLKKQRYACFFLKKKDYWKMVMPWIFEEMMCNFFFQKKINFWKMGWTWCFLKKKLHVFLKKGFFLGKNFILFL